MFDPSKTRYAVINNRAIHADDAAKRDDALVGLMSAAMTDFRTATGSVSRDQLRDICGFTDDEIDRLGARATDDAASDWHGHNRLEAAA